MKKKIAAVVCSAALSVSMAVPAFAGQWVSDSVGWWWQNDDGSYPVSGWQWIDGNTDGIAECYYFDSNGYMLADTTTPDGYTVNADGAWLENGAVQMQAAAIGAESATEATGAETTAVETQTGVGSVVQVTDGYSYQITSGYTGETMNWTYPETGETMTIPVVSVDGKVLFRSSESFLWFIDMYDESGNYLDNIAKGGIEAGGTSEEDFWMGSGVYVYVENTAIDEGIEKERTIPTVAICVRN